MKATIIVLDFFVLFCFMLLLKKDQYCLNRELNIAFISPTIWVPIFKSN